MPVRPLRVHTAGMKIESSLLAAAFLALACPARAHFQIAPAWRSGSEPATPGHSVASDGGGGLTSAPQGQSIGIIAPMAADSDGAQGGHNDSATHSEKTSLMVGGQALDASQVCYVVLPLQEGWKCSQELKQVQLGDLVKLTANGKTVWGIAGDKGPADSSKFGEASLACIKQLGQDPKGGNSGFEGQVLYEFYPGSGGGVQPKSNQEVLARLSSMDGQAGQEQGGVQQASGNAKPFSQCSGGETREARRDTSTKGA